MDNIEIMSTEYPETIYYYAVRDPADSYCLDPRINVPEYVVKEWDIVFLIQSYSLHPNGIIYVPDKKDIKQLYFLHHMSFHDFDLLTAFDVPSVVGFETKYWRTRDGLVLS